MKLFERVDDTLQVRPGSIPFADHSDYHRIWFSGYCRALDDINEFAPGTTEGLFWQAQMDGKEFHM